MPTGKQWDRQGKVLRGSDVQKPQPFGAAVFLLRLFLSLSSARTPSVLYLRPPIKIPSGTMDRAGRIAFFLPSVEDDIQQHRRHRRQQDPAMKNGFQRMR